MPPAPPRTLATCLMLAYATVAFVPCVDAPIPSPGDAHAAHDHAADGETMKSHGDHGAAHGGHHGHGAHAGHQAPPADARIAEWRAPCPCGCGDAPGNAQNASPRIGWALAGLQPSLAPPPERTALEVATQSAPNPPPNGPEFVPV